MAKWIMNPFTTNRNREWWRFITSGFIHSNYMHLGFNLLVMHSFGGQVLNVFSQPNYFGKAGPIFYLLLFVLGVIVSDIPTYFRNKDNPAYNSLGASGGVSSIVFAFVILFPMSELGLLFIPFFKLPAFVFATLYMIYSHFQGKRGTDNINHSAHIWGSVFGVVFISVLRPESLLDFFRTLLSILPF